MKRLKVVEITPDGNLVVLSGRNGQGKSSVLDAIWLALANAEAAKATPRPVRDGADKAKVVLDLGDFIVTRSWTSDDKSYLSVQARDGAKYPSPQKILDGLIGSLALDPLEFLGLNDKAQVDTLLGLVGAGDVLHHLDERRAELYTQRTEAGRELKRLEGVRASLPPLPADAPESEVSLSELSTQLQVALGALAEHAELQSAVTKAKDDHAKAAAEVLRLQQELTDALKASTEASQRLRERLGALAKWEAPSPSAEELAVRLRDAEALNAKAKTAADRRKSDADIAAAQSTVAELTDAIGVLDQEKAATVAATAMPVEGLGWSEAGVTYRGLPLRQASDAEQLRVSIAMAMAQNPKLRVLRVRQGSRLDRTGLKLLAAMADAHDVQVWVEVVTDPGQGIGVVLEDGEVAEVVDAAGTGPGEGSNP